MIREVSGMMNVTSRVERLLRTTGIKPTQFGRRVLNDPRFVHDLRNGRQLRPETEARLSAWLDSAESGMGAETCE
jgi:2,4-dienoyl-CoA reductase-like NADH-dependent reductase (Old Yellow Enzyme family)